MFPTDSDTVLAPVLNIVSERHYSGIRASQSERAGDVLPIDERQGVLFVVDIRRSPSKALGTLESPEGIVA